VTIITVNTPVDRITAAQRCELAETLTDAVLVPELGQFAVQARIGFQVHFVEHAFDKIAIGGRLLIDCTPPPDLATIDIAVMDAAWSAATRRAVIERVLRAMANACGLEQASPAWWVTFRTIDEGSWGARGGVLSIRDLLASGAFSSERITEIHQRMNDSTSHAC